MITLNRIEYNVIPLPMNKCIWRVTASFSSDTWETVKYITIRCLEDAGRTKLAKKLKFIEKFWMANEEEILDVVGNKQFILIMSKNAHVL